MRIELRIVTAKVTPVEMMNITICSSLPKEISILVPTGAHSEEIRVVAFIGENGKFYGFSKTSGDAVLVTTPYVMCHITCEYSDKPKLCYKYNGKYYLDMIQTKDGARYLRHELNLRILDDLENLF